MTKHLIPAEHTQLWDTFRRGNRDAFSQMYALFAADLYRYGYNLVRNRLLVEDCLHELFLHIYENHQRLGATDNIRFYLYRALRRRLLDAANQFNKFDSDTHRFPETGFFSEPYETILIDNEDVEQQKELIARALDKLPKRQKEILYLVYTKELSYQETAKVMDISMKSVYNTISAALIATRSLVHRSIEPAAVAHG